MTMIHIDWGGSYSFNQEDFAGICTPMANYGRPREDPARENLYKIIREWVTQTFHTTPTQYTRQAWGMSFHITDKAYKKYIHELNGEHDG